MTRVPKLDLSAGDNGEGLRTISTVGQTGHGLATIYRDFLVPVRVSVCLVAEGGL
ncbi:hypothetical protein [Roseiconus lacunae]|uniref:Uncharacterized protein n=1 Tax=Roseiconus lacunae TaxID=2605694 RepID=A0ABT7PJM9_9BACT|nr:hypothetical protein [Roseiconus lacunae]MCD0458509.1 hypothetical protein [Roseiconus lacunae]MDM4016396.1 hypothetical protein [Roseiconus lacunae]WRQ52001.1 hypothetical protein U8335_05555 [Stieleria sp. HD01]